MQILFNLCIIELNIYIMSYDVNERRHVYQLYAKHEHELLRFIFRNPFSNSPIRYAVVFSKSTFSHIL